LGTSGGVNCPARRDALQCTFVLSLQSRALPELHALRMHALPAKRRSKGAALNLAGSRADLTVIGARIERAEAET